jgi:hypothetical protein
MTEVYMMKPFVYDFPDEIAESFFYDSKNKLIEVCFEACCCNGEFIEFPCKLVIENWIQAKSKLHSAIEYDSLESNLGVISLILSITNDGEDVLLMVSTLDDKYVNLVFTKPYIHVETLS